MQQCLSLIIDTKLICDGQYNFNNERKQCKSIIQKLEPQYSDKMPEPCDGTGWGQ